MGQRHYPNFIDAYMEYSRDHFVPDKFHFWAGVSVVAAALERKVWIPWSEDFEYYPNLFILLVSHPGIGKSTAINPGVDLLRSIQSNIKFIPSKITEAKLIDLMRVADTFQTGPNSFIPHCSGFFAASEASSSLRNIYGPFVETITEFYDCGKICEKATMSMKGETFKLENVCFNLVAGCTFDYLRELITDKNIMGGFASRITYVIQRDVYERESKWQNRGITKTDKVTKRGLIEDLQQIYSLVGAMTADDSFKDAYEKWFKVADKERQALPSEKLQSLKARKHTTALKLCMILTAAESNSKVMTESHWRRALELTEDVEKYLPDMLRESKSRDTETQDGLNNAVFKVLKYAPERKLKRKDLIQKLMFMGFMPLNIENTISRFTTDGSVLRLYMTTDGDTVELVGDPNNYL